MKKFILHIFSILFVITASSFTVHDFYTSTTKVDFNLASSTVQFSTKIDVEHLEEAIGESTSGANFNTKLKSYLSNHFKVKINDSSKEFVFANSKVTGEVIWIYFNIPNVKELNSIEIDNTLLFEKYPEQQNYVNFNINGQRDSMIAKKGNSAAKKTFN